MNETIAIAIPVFDSVKQPAYRAHLEMAAKMGGSDCDVWWLKPDWERRTYPFCVQGMVEEMFATEKAEGRKADWFFWLEDDIVPDKDIYFQLREAASPEDRPYVSALAYCRTRPYHPGVADVIDKDGMKYVRQWQDAPHSGTVPADRIGMCAALFHRSLFDRVSEPWFAVDVSSGIGIGPDSFWCRRLKDSGIQPYLCCDTRVGHVGTAAVITQEISEQWNAARKSTQHQ